MNLEQWTRIDSLFHEVLDQAPADRAAFLDSACLNDFQLRRRIEILIAQSRKTDESFQAEFSDAASEALQYLPERFARGQEIGHYEIVSLIGSGGMGEVYKATDRRLKRVVAIKVLPLAFTTDPARLDRFHREAELLASLTHPNIAVVHGIEYAEGTPSIILELVEGETLVERITRGVPLDEALRIARQIAEALEAAHEKGVIHRDLKPANIKVTPDGRVKVLDFGLATILQGSTSESASSLQSTCEGSLLAGTPRYMSPEQARNRKVDRASDIWAFGCVLFELLTGRPVFKGNSTIEIFAAVVDTEPDWNVLPDSTPHSVRKLLQRCLHKDRNRRLHDIADARIEIEEALSAPVQSHDTPVSHRRLMFWLIFGTLCVALAISLTLTLYRFDRAALQSARFTIELSNLLNPSISPNGRYIAFSGGPGGLWLRPLDSFAPPTAVLSENVLVSGPPIWAPDSKTIAFFNAKKLMRIGLDGGPPQFICDVPDPIPAGGRVASWGANGVIVFENQMGLYKVSAEGGNSTPVRLPDTSKHEKQYRFPYFLPNGVDYLFLADAEQPADSEIRAASLDRSMTKTVTHDRSSAVFSPPGYIVFAREGSLVAKHFDVTTWSVSGDPIIVHKPFLLNQNGWASIHASANGTLVYRLNASSNKTQLTWFDRYGRDVLVEPEDSSSSPALSADGKLMAFANSGIWIRDIIRGTNTKLSAGINDQNPIISPDGSTIVFASNVSGSFQLYRKPISSTGEPELLGYESFAPSSWSSDGQFILFSRSGPSGLQDVWMLSIPDAKATPLLQSRFRETQARFSPDGKWFAYMSDASGRAEVYVQPFPTTGEYRQISANGGAGPHWRGDGKELFFVTPDTKTMMAVAVSSGRKFTSGVPRKLFSIPAGTLGFNFAVSQDGERFVLPVRVDMPAQKLNVILNWDAELNRRK